MLLEKYASVCESLLFVSDKPVGIRRFKSILGVDDVNVVREALELVRKNTEQPGRGMELVEVADGYQFRTVEGNAQWILKFCESKPQRLSRAALETLAIITYRQPVTRPEIEEIRGVDSGGVLKTLLEKDLVRIMGKSEHAGSPLIYGTTDTFLNFFSIKSLKDLPSLREYQDLQEDTSELTLDDFAAKQEGEAVAADACEDEVIDEDSTVEDAIPADLDTVNA